MRNPVKFLILVVVVIQINYRKRGIFIMKEVLILQAMEVGEGISAHKNRNSAVSISCKKESTISLFICVFDPK